MFFPCLDPKRRFVVFESATVLGSTGLMPMKLRSRSKAKQDDAPSATADSPPLEDQQHQKSKSKIWRLFDITKSPIFTKSTMARLPGDDSASRTCDKSVATSVYEGGTILEEEYQDSIGMQGQKCQSLLLAYAATGAAGNSSILCALTPPGKSVELGGDSKMKHGLHSAPFLSPCRATVGPHETRHHSTSLAPQLLHSRSSIPRGRNLANGDRVTPSSPTLEANSIYNEPCDSKNLQTSTRRSSTRRASLAAGIYCDTEHHRAFDSSPHGSADSLPLKGENPHPSEHSKRLSGLSVGTNSSVPLLTDNGPKGSCEPSGYFSNSAKETCRFSVDSGSSSVSTSRDASAHTNSLFETQHLLIQVR
ncbi:hypothetical protein SprV_0401554700 [Sparganum proliferum]